MEGERQPLEGQLQLALGRNLRKVREGLDLSQEQFGELVGWHRTLVGAVERGERNLTLRSVERVCIRLAVDPLELLAAPSTVVAPTLRAAAEGGDATDPPADRTRRPRGT